MKSSLLILGGTQQIGRRLIEVLQASDKDQYDIHLFNRGKTNPHLFPFAKRIIGDRNTDAIEQIFARDWDIVLDCTCYQPHSLQKILKGLKGRVGRYILISTISVYDYEQNKENPSPIAEDFPLRSFTQDQINAEGFRFYGEKKVAAEQFLQESEQSDHIILRPHFIYGRYDWQNLDYYWMYRLRHFDRLLLPEGGQDLVHRSYIEDLVKALLVLMELPKHRQVYNFTSHPAIPLHTYLDTLEAVMGTTTQRIPAPTAFLQEQKIRPVYDIPLWSNGSHFQFSNAKLEADVAMAYTRLDQSMEETYAWNQERSEWKEGRLGMSREKEEALLKQLAIHSSVD